MKNQYEADWIDSVAKRAQAAAELREAVQPIRDLIKKNYCRETSIVISINSVKVTIGHTEIYFPNESMKHDLSAGAAIDESQIVLPEFEDCLHRSSNPESENILKQIADTAGSIDSQIKAYHAERRKPIKCSINVENESTGKSLADALRERGML